VINECQFSGSEHYETHGVCCYKANLSIKNSVMKNHHGAAVMLQLDKSNVCSIYLCEIYNNNYGIFSSGYNKKSKIKDCFI